MMMPAGSGPRAFFEQVATYMSPNFKDPRGIVGIFAYTGLIFFFTYFYTAIQFNVDDITMQLKRSQAMIPGVRPGKQTRDFLDGVITRVTVVGAFCLAIVALTQYVVPVFINVASVAALFGTSLLILVSVALETMRQIEANIMMKQYGQ
jgi:preprotein translocase subunit SecY